jgi:penicillin-binding protein 2
MGYIGEADSAVIRKSKNFYRLGDYVGRNGLEAYYENVLMGKRGTEYMIKDNKNRLVGSYENGRYDTSAVAGRNIQTYIDIEVQQLAEKLLANKVGAIVAIEPKTGGIIAMASGPHYNPNDLTGPERQKNFSKLALNVAAPLFNRAIKGQYPAGSTYKPIGALIALDEGLINQSSSIFCAGTYSGCNRPVNCTEKFPGHSGSLRQSIAWSCNSFFCDVFRRTVDNPKFRNPRKGLTLWKDYMSAFGFGHRIGVDLPSEDGGNIPDTAQYDKEYRGSWNSCTMVTLGIGQDKMTATPLQMANAMCIIANKGYYYVPHFVKSIEKENEQDTLLRKFRVKHEVLTHISNALYEDVISGMQDVVEIGTARIAQIPGINICAKTGTAENKMLIDGKVLQLKDNSMFVCFAPRENPRIAVAVVIQNAGFGATWAAPIGSLILEKFLKDSLRPESEKKIEEISQATLMPSYLPRLQFKTDSTRAFQWFQMTKDSSYIQKFIRRGASPKLPPSQTPKPVIKKVAILPDEKKPTFTYSAKR